MPTAQVELEEELAKRPDRVLVIIGAGASSASSGNARGASWYGLLQDGLEHCANHCPNLPTGWLERTTKQLQENDLTSMLGIATEITSHLNKLHRGEFALWLGRTIGGLDVKDSRIIEEILGWGVQIATTNYDGLIEKIGHQESITWQERGLAGEFLRGDNRDILHLHGYWRKPETVILDCRSYEDIVRDDHTQNFLRSTLMTRTLVFIGCGAGLEDPNFGSLFEWAKETLSHSHHRHFRLARSSEVADLQKQHAGVPIRVLAYGDNYSDLPIFLQTMNHRLRQRAKHPMSPIEELIRIQAEFTTFFRELNSQKAGMDAAVYAVRLFDLTKRLWEAGGTEAAASNLVHLFHQEAQSLDAKTRLSMGAEAVEMFLRDGQHSNAGHVMQSLSADLPAAENDPPLANRLRLLAIECFNQQCDYESEMAALSEAITASSDPTETTRLSALRKESQFLQGDILPAPPFGTGGAL